MRFESKSKSKSLIGQQKHLPIHQTKIHKHPHPQPQIDYNLSLSNKVNNHIIQMLSSDFSNVNTLEFNHYFHLSKYYEKRKEKKRKERGFYSTMTQSWKDSYLSFPSHVLK